MSTFIQLSAKYVIITLSSPFNTNAQGSFPAAVWGSDFWYQVTSCGTVIGLEMPQKVGTFEICFKK
jgi:hypothetical protein